MLALLDEMQAGTKVFPYSSNVPHFALHVKHFLCQTSTYFHLLYN